MRSLAWVELVASWCVWWAAYLVLAPKHQKRESVTASAATRIGLLGEVFGLFLIFGFRVPGAPRTSAVILVSAGILGVLAGVLMWTAVAHLGRQFRITAGLYSDHKLVRAGPYALVRHPIYTSFLSITIGTGLLMTSWLWFAIALALFVAGTEIRARAEDRLLASRFGGEFTKYKGQVPAYVPSLAIVRLADAWLRAHFEWLVWAVVGLGLALRIARAGALYLNGDEAMIMVAPLQPTLGEVYQRMLAHPHGPLPNFLLHFMAYLGSSDLYFRLPSVIAGALVPYVVYRWVAETWDKGAGFVAACILSFSPAMVILSSQLRFYTMQMLFMACSLYCLERGLREKSPKWIRLFGAALLLALWSEYMSAWYTAAIGAYAAVRVLSKATPGRLKLEWAITQVAAAALIVIAYLTHLRGLQGNEGELLARDFWLRASYFHPQSQTLWNFLRTATVNLFEYLFANLKLGEWMILVFGIGIVLLLSSTGRRRLAALSLLFPLAVTIGAASLQIYPYGGSRHDAFLAVFLSAAIGVALSFAMRNHALALVLAMACLITAWPAAAQQHPLDDKPAVSKREQMRRALTYLSQQSPQVRVLVVDQLGSATVGYYLCHGRLDDWRELLPGSKTYQCAGYRILTVETWGAPVAAYGEALMRAREKMPDLFPDPAWAFLISFTRETDENTAAAGFGRFGKIELWDLWRSH
ncbi:MAG: hypothetical protein C5B51_27430 [Terriglobia bacterium]|nr:MAG: hypothetical protein C5B51_27430 [Terriglobia bacterium]